MSLILAAVTFSVLWSSNLTGGSIAVREAWFDFNRALCATDGEHRKVKTDYKMGHGEIGLMFMCLVKEKEKMST